MLVSATNIDVERLAASLWPSDVLPPFPQLQFFALEVEGHTGRKIEEISHASKRTHASCIGSDSDRGTLSGLLNYSAMNRDAIYRRSAAFAQRRADQAVNADDREEWLRVAEGWRSAPIVRFIVFEILATGVVALECFRNSA